MSENIKRQKEDVSLQTEEFLKAYGRKKIVAAFTLGCP